MSDSDVHLEIAEQVLRDRFALPSLYPIQERIVLRLLGGGDAMVVLPTGSGKSLCYQLPALIRDRRTALPRRGVTLVFSPLIALMEDQVAALRAKGIRAQYINSTLDRKEREARYEALGEGAYDLIYATPERMLKPEFCDALDRVDGGVRLLAIDEAHCITKWGHDFRPAYRDVGQFRKDLGCPLTVALTATATPTVRSDIRATLELDEESLPLFAEGIDRPNLSFEVREVWDDGDRLDAIDEVAESSFGTGIVYFALIKKIEELAADIRRRHDGEVEIYHGRLDPREKKRVYQRFTKARPEDRLLLLATNAFGMGVDKPDIRFIVHAQVPGSVEAYYQEVGRAGRDGDPSRCVMLYDQADLAIQQTFVEWMNPGPQLLEEAAMIFADMQGRDLSTDDLREAITGRNRGDRRADYCVITLAKLGVIELSPVDGNYRFVRPLAEEDVDVEEIAEKRERDLRRLLDIVQLTKSDDIRQAILDYFDL